MALFGEAVAKALLARHEGNGTRFRLDARVTAFEGDRRLEAAVTDGGERLAADLAVVAVGAEPATGFLEGVERDADGGIPVDAGMRAAAPGLFAAGDVACFPLPWDPTRVRLERWRLACEGGRVAARNMIGLDTVYDGVPFFWSAQHLVLYHVGHAGPGAEVVLDGEPGAGPFLAYYVEDDRVTAALGVERNAEMAALQELMRVAGPVEAERVRGGRFDAVRALHDLPPGVTLRAAAPAGTRLHLRDPSTAPS
jgi:NADPH-dependent 2,4-dienoyl-CoA reductase/sulfur reductase-like enzyme